MTGIRQSFVFGLEGVDSAGKSNFGKGKGKYHNEGSYSDYSWVSPPPGSFFVNTSTRSTTRLNSEGTKFWDAMAYGHYSGTWEWTFVLDYDYLEPLILAFDSYSVTARGVHNFSKMNNKRVPSFSVRRKKLNEMAGGPADSDEVEELYGCVCRNVSFSRSSSNSQTNVTMSGVYVDERMLTGNLEATDYQEYNGHLVEFTCLFFGTAISDNYVSNVDSLSISMGNNAFTADNVCSPFSTEFGEGASDFSMNASSYANDPTKWAQKVYAGGKTVDWSQYSRIGPLSKELGPVPLITFASYNRSARDYNDNSIEDAIAASSRTVTFSLEKVVLRSLTWQKGDGSKLQDQISSAECRKMSLSIKNGDTDNLMTAPAHAVTSADPN